MQQELQHESISQTEVNEIPSIIFKSGSNYFAILSENVTSISILPENLTGLPEAPDYIRGLASLREACIPVLDLRTVLKAPKLSLEVKEFEDMIEERKKDHQRWAAELVRSIDEERPFTLTADPHQCAFGKWYDSYKTSNSMVQFQLKKIDEPHKRLHKVAEETQKVLTITDEEKREAALDEIKNQLENQILPTMLHLLDDTKKIMGDSIREMMLVLNDGEKQAAIAVDEVLRVEHLEPVADNLKIDDVHQMNYVTGILKSKDQVVLLLDEKRLLDLM